MVSNQVPCMYSLWGIVSVQTIAKEWLLHHFQYLQTIFPVTYLLKTSIWSFHCSERGLNVTSFLGLKLKVVIMAQNTAWSISWYPGQPHPLLLPAVSFCLGQQLPLIKQCIFPGQQLPDADFSLESRPVPHPLGSLLSSDSTLLTNLWYSGIICSMALSEIVMISLIGR